MNVCLNLLLLLELGTNALRSSLIPLVWYNQFDFSQVNYSDSENGALWDTRHNKGPVRFNIIYHYPLLPEAQKALDFKCQVGVSNATFEIRFGSVTTLYLSIYLLILSRSISDHHLRCGVGV